MDSSNQHSNETPDTVNALAETVDEESEAILKALESEPKEAGDEQFSGNDLDEALEAVSDPVLDELESVPAEASDEQFSGNELNEALESASDPILDELESELTDASDDPFSGNELDEVLDEESETVLEEIAPAIKGQSDTQPADIEPGAAPDKAHDVILEEIKSVDGVTPVADVAIESLPKEGRLKGLAKTLENKKRLSIVMAMGLLLLVGIGSLYRLNPKAKTPAIDNFAASALVTQAPMFDLFVIPLKEHEKFTYISLSLSFDLTNDDLNKEFFEKKVLLRGIIYDILNQEINKAKEIPPVEDLKKFILKEVNHVLANGAVHRAYIMNFLAV